jgi:ligand-binding SRPBCC domain-containing protein
VAKTTTITKINAPVERVFAYISEPTNQVEIWPSLIEVKDVERLPGGGYSHSWVYKMAGVRMTGSTRTTEFVPNSRFVEVTEGGVSSTITWRFEPEDGGTRLVVETEYTVPVPVLGRMAEALIVKMNQREAELIMANLKARMEA